MSYVPDLTIRGPDDSLVAIVEVKAGGSMSPEWAKGIFVGYRDAVGGVPAEYFLVLSPGRGYLWKRDSLQPDDNANAEFDFGEVLAGYLDPEKDFPRARALEYVVFRWLFDVALGSRTPKTDAEHKLEQVGFTRSIRDARVAFGLAA